jgi:PAS domain-containing protein
LAQRLSDIGETEIVASVLDAIPSPIFVVDDDVRIVGVNLAASQMLAQNPQIVIRRRAGEILHCVHSTEAPGGCGQAPPCQDCPVRQSVNESVRHHRVVRKRAKMELVREGCTVPMYLLVTTAPFIYQDQAMILLTLEDISELMELVELVPICSYCKKIRNDQEYWMGIENYFKEHLDLEFTHGICPECSKKLLQEL